MPIGKNSLKRVTNNGYSKVRTSAPDMENSEVSLVDEAGKHTEEILSPKTDEGKAAIARAKEKVSEVKEAKKKSETKPKTSEKIAPSQKAKETVKSMTAEEKKTSKSTPKKSSSAVVKKSSSAVAKKSPEKKTESASKVETPKTEEKKEVSVGSEYVNVGRGMPYYLL